MNYFSEGNKFYNDSDYKSAIYAYKKAIEMNDNLPCCYYNIGVCHIKLKEYDAGIIVLKKAIEIQEESKYFFNLAYCHAMKNEVKKALINFNIAWSLDNNDEECEKAINLISKKNKKSL